MLVVDGITKSYPGAGAVLGGLDFTVPDGDLTCLVGPSGAGKTTLLRCISGLLRPDAGHVVLDGEQVTRPPAGLAVVFQEYTRSLMPWLTVQRNVALPLERLRLPKREAAERVEHALHAVGLSGAERLHPWQLSGGMQQRVAIARAVAYRPSLLLMDEPFASVDAQTRADLEDLMLAVHREYGTTILFVTHDIDEAVYLGQHVVVLSSRPATVAEVIDVDLPGPRDQIATKQLPEFARLRAHVFRRIMRGRNSGADVDHSPGGTPQPRPMAMAAAVARTAAP